MESTTEEIQPIDYLVLAGFMDRFQQVFGCAKCAYINANDKTKILNRIFGEGKPLEYPYAYFEIKSIEANDETYNPHYFMRRGMVRTVNSNSTLQTVRLMPTNFEIEITYVTNRFQSVAQGSVLAFSRRWLLARRGGYLKTSVDYGRMQLGIGVTLDKSVVTPSRENITEAETSFPVTTRAIIHGYVSEPVPGSKGLVTQFNVNASIGGVNSSKIISSQFLAFPEKS